MSKTYKSDIMAAVHESASDLHELGMIPKSTMREFDELCLTPVKKLSAKEIKKIREENQASQAVFARYINVTPLAISQWECGLRSPNGAALKLLNLIKEKGLASIA